MSVFQQCSCIAVLTILCAVIQKTQCQIDCSPCKCVRKTWHDRQQLVGNCTHLSLLEIPSTLDKTINILDLSHNKINSLQLLAMPRFAYLTVLMIKHNDLKSIPPSSLSTILLDEVYLGGNKLVKVDYSLFESSRYLRVLDGIESYNFEEDSFKDLSSLQELSIIFIQENIPTNILANLKLHRLRIYLKYAKSFPANLLKSSGKTLSSLIMNAPRLTTFDEDSFRGLSQLEEMSLSFGSLPSLPVLTLSGSHTSSFPVPVHLLTLTISGLGSLPRDIFRGQKRIERLDLRKIEDLPAGLFDSIDSLHHLSLSESNVQSISYHWFTNLRNLKTLNLSSTGLTDLTEESFRGLGSLMTLDLSDNHIKILSESVFHHFSDTLCHLNASHNKISVIKGGVLKGMFSLDTLDLSHNSIRELSPTSFFDLEKLKTLKLQYNKLYFIPSDVLETQRDLLYLNLSYNNLTTLPESLLVNLRSLRFLDVSNNPIATFPENFFRNSRFLERLLMTGNPVHCDCRLFILRSATSRSRLNMTGICSTPDELNGIPVNSVSLDTTNCSVTRATQILESADSSFLQTSYSNYQSTDSDDSIFFANSNHKNQKSYTTVLHSTIYEKMPSQSKIPIMPITKFQNTSALHSISSFPEETTHLLISEGSIYLSSIETTFSSKNSVYPGAHPTPNRPTVFEGKDFDLSPDSGMNTFYVVIGLIGGLFILAIGCHITRRGRFADICSRSRSYEVSRRQDIVDDNKESALSSDQHYCSDKVIAKPEII